MLQLDLRLVPFSCAGAWTDLSYTVAEHDVRADVHLVSHVSGMHGVLALVPWLDGARVEAAVVADPASLSWVTPTGAIEAVYEDAATLRIAGSGVDLRIAGAEPTLTPFSGTYLVGDPATASHVFTSYETGRRYRVTVVSGAVRPTGAEAIGAAERAVEVTADGAERWEVALEELETSRARFVPSRTFEDVRESAVDRFASYLDQIAPWRDDSVPATAQAAYVLWSATVAPAGFVRRPAVLMSKHWMDKVWSWDHCFNALALAEGDPDLAWHQLRAPFDHQDAGGALPDSITHSEVLHNFVKPPIHGWALDLLLERLPLVPPDEELRAVYRQLSRWSEFWLDLRRAPGSALPYYQHGNDSGWDNATVFADGQLVETPDLAAFLVLQLGSLDSLARRLGLHEEAERWAAARSEVLEALLGTLWDGRHLGYRAVSDRALRRSTSLLGLLPLLLGDDLPAEVREALLDRVPELLTEHGLATEPPASPAYEPDGYWRGPIWAPSTVLLVDGMRRCGRDDLAETVASRFLALCEASGFAENFDALTGAGLRDRAYTWTASAYLLLARERARPPRTEAVDGLSVHAGEHTASHPGRTP